MPFRAQMRAVLTLHAKCFHGAVVVNAVKQQLKQAPDVGLAKQMVSAV
jgi:hypothetical protein